MSIIIDGTGNITGVSSNGGLSAAQTGSVIQVVSVNYATSNAYNSVTSPVDSGLSASITPKFSTSKILILISQNFEWFVNNNAGFTVNLNICRNSSPIITYYNVNYQQLGTGGNGYQDQYATPFLQYLDSPATTSSVAYKTQGYTSSSGVTNGLRFQSNAVGNQPTSTITLMEIAG